MKRTGNIWEQLVSTENLTLAFHEAQRKKRRYREVRAFMRDLTGNIKKLQDQLVSGTWKVYGYRQFLRFDGNKFRLIDWDPYFPDNIVQHAIEQTAGQVLLAAGIKDTYAGIRKRGIKRGYKRMKKFLSEYGPNEPIYVLKVDVRKFYQSVNTGILKQKIRRKIKDKKVLALFDEIIDSHPDGLPIGNYLSQLLANYYLAEFDHWIKNQHFRHYSRYCDDIVVICNDKDRLRNLLSAMHPELAKIGLTLKSNAQIFPIERYGIDFIGFVFRRHCIRLRKSIEHKFKRAAHIFKQNPTEKNYRRLASYNGWIKCLSHGKRLWFSILDKDVKALHKEIKKCK